MHPSNLATAENTLHEGMLPKQIHDTSGHYHVVAASSATDDRTRVLKYGDTFAVFDHYGDIKPGGLGEEGLYHEGTRYLSCFLLKLEGERPFFLNSTVGNKNGQFTIALTNPDLFRDGKLYAALGTVYLAIKKFLWQGVAYQELHVKNHGLIPLKIFLSLYFAADFADIFEVRGMKRTARGEYFSPEVSGDRVVLGYRGLDGVTRRTLLNISPPPSNLTSSTAQFELSLQPKDEATFDISIGCERSHSTCRVLSFDDARRTAESTLEKSHSWACHLETSNGQVNDWLGRAMSDLDMMTTELPTGPYPYAGVPWFNTPFGRDGIITALESLWWRPSLAKGVLTYLASTQATEVRAEDDAEPGKILHETRGGEMATLKEMPFGQYYGSVDATPLFVLLAGAYYERTGDRSLIEGLWPNVQAAIAWIDEYGDRDGDGFVEYQRQATTGLLHQGWKDSDDAIFHQNGKLAEGPIALCEVQGYVYAARRAGALLAAELGDEDRARQLLEQAESLREQFDRAFWQEELSTYALALDGEKRPCCVRNSNAGQCLFTRIARPLRAKRLAQTLFQAELFSGWGIRTLASGEQRYNPMGYHNGCVWPHDNALIALGLARYGLTEQALEIWTGMFEAGLQLDLHRMPELFCGFSQSAGEGPIPYPVACSPQAWSAAAVGLLVQSALGLEIDGRARTVCFTRPCLPSCVNELWIHNLEVAGSTIDLLFVRHEHDVGVNVLRREGDIELCVLK